VATNNQCVLRGCLAYQKDSKLIKPARSIGRIYNHTKGDAYVSSDVGASTNVCALYYPLPKPRRWINSGGLGTMGFGLTCRHGRANGLSLLATSSVIHRACSFR